MKGIEWSRLESLPHTWLVDNHKSEYTEMVSELHFIELLKSAPQEILTKADLIPKDKITTLPADELAKLGLQVIPEEPAIQCGPDDWEDSIGFGGYCRVHKLYFQGSCADRLNQNSGRR